MKRNAISSVLARGQKIHSLCRWKSQMCGFGLFHPVNSLQQTNVQSHVQFVYSSVQLRTCHHFLLEKAAPQLRGLTDRTDLLVTGYTFFFFFHVLPYDWYLEL